MGPFASTAYIVADAVHDFIDPNIQQSEVEEVLQSMENKHQKTYEILSNLTLLSSYSNDKFSSFTFILKDQYLNHVDDTTAYEIQIIIQEYTSSVTFALGELKRAILMFKDNKESWIMRKLPALSEKIYTISPTFPIKVLFSVPESLRVYFIVKVPSRILEPAFLTELIQQ